MTNKASIQIRAAHAPDYPECVALLEALRGATGGGETFINEATFAELITNERGRIVVAEEVTPEGEASSLLGMASVSYNVALRYGGEYCQLEELIVSSDARGKNIGGLLIARTIEDAEERGCREYGLYLVATTEHNRPFYEKFGFEPVGTEMRRSLQRV